jgi:hypothetical protein
VQGQTAKLLSHSVISAHPPDPVHYEKSIGNFTSTSYPSFFLGTLYEGYIFDTQTGTNCSIGIPGFYYERSKPFTFPGDKYTGLIASLATNVSFLGNPLNWGGSLCGDWPMQVINANEGAHELHLADLDGDGKLDVLASGLAAYGFSTGFLSFQNTSTWTLGAFIPPAGESINVLAVNGGARTNIVACNPNNNSLYWYQNPGGSAARGKGWTSHLIASTSISGQPACKQGVSLGSLNVGNRDIVLVASNETDNGVPWTPGLGYFDPGSNPNGLWTFHQIDGTYRDVHEIATDVLNGTPFFTVGEQEQASTICNGMGYNDHGNSYSGCRVSIFAWNGTGFAAPTLVSNLGSHSQTLYQLNGIEYMAGANHDGYIATDPAYNLWTFNFSSGGGGGGTPLIAGNYNIKDPNTGDTMDLGWALNPQWGNNGPYVYLFNYNNGSSQQITFTSSGQLQSVQNPGEFFYNNGNALAIRSSGGDTFSVTASGIGYTIRDTSAGGLYVNTASAIDPPNKLALSSTPTVWMFSALSTGGGGGLPSGKYNFQDGFGNTIDLGWGLHPEWGFGTYVYLYSYNNGTSQQIVFTSSGQLQSVANTSQFVTNSGGFLSLGTTGDVFTITASGSGYTIFDKTEGLYVNTPGKIDPPNKLALSSTPTVWMAKPQQ